ncbi:MAG: hypothetical protein GY820_31290 [Gammaproteobacteria bacterium]|nr:hypothetical protein [Gammaproteobacteria bacterium]
MAFPAGEKKNFVTKLITFLQSSKRKNEALFDVFQSEVLTDVIGGARPYPSLVEWD